MRSCPRGGRQEAKREAKGGGAAFLLLPAEVPWKNCWQPGPPRPCGQLGTHPHTSQACGKSPLLTHPEGGLLGEAWSKEQRPLEPPLSHSPFRLSKHKAGGRGEASVHRGRVQQHKTSKEWRGGGCPACPRAPGAFSHLLKKIRLFWAGVPVNGRDALQAVLVPNAGRKRVGDDSGRHLGWEEGGGGTFRPGLARGRGTLPWERAGRGNQPQGQPWLWGQSPRKRAPAAGPPRPAGPAPPPRGSCPAGSAGSPPGCAGPSSAGHRGPLPRWS